jgi:hypothetical protein
MLAAPPRSFNATVSQLKIKAHSTALPELEQEQEGGAIELALIQAHIDDQGQQRRQQQQLPHGPLREQAPSAWRRTTGGSQSNTPLLAAAASIRSLLAGSSQRWVVGSAQAVAIRLHRNLSGPLQQHVVPGSLLRDR